ncbi:hypothetical protein [Nocardioides jensenii]|uniref:hypothetical protein n=1 Tax=Nocardioides jensenii TaxID=1843 RepID=UPI000832A425|nr:hypothetical protein [Nocardioides jensenii]
MDADHPRFADVDDALFDTTRIPRTSRDIRTVGELLHDVDHSARQLLLDVTGDDAGRLLHAWPGLVTAAASLWNSLPGQGPRDVVYPRDVPITHLAALAGAIGQSLQRTSWPPTSRPDPRLTQMARTFRQARDLVHRYGAEIPLHRSGTFRDLEAARARTMHSLYISAHALGVSLHQYGQARYEASLESDSPLQLSQLHSAYALRPTTGWIGRMSVSERLAGRYLDGRFTETLQGEAIAPIEDDTRLPRALAGWDIQAHRTLASDAWPTNMVLITRTQGLIAGAAMVLVDAAQLAGHLEPTDRLIPAIAETGRAWSNLASRWGDLTLPHARLDPNLMRAAAELRAAYRELTHDATTMASLTVIATRPGLERGTMASLHALESGAELAYVVAEKASTPGLTGPARALSIRAHNDIELGLADPHPDGDVVWVSPAAILARRTILVPPPVRESLRAASASTAAATSVAAAVTTVVLANSQDAATASEPQQPHKSHLRSNAASRACPDISSARALAP